VGAADVRVPRVFLADAVAPGDVVALPEAAAHHLGNVLRLVPGMSVLGIAPQGSAWDLTWMGEGRAAVVARSSGPSAEPDTLVTLAVAVPKGDRMDWLVEKAGELGAAALVPLWTDRSPMGAQVGPGRFSRWERLARAAAAQSGRRRVPAILPAADLVSTVQGFDGIRLLTHPTGEATPLRELLATVPAGAVGSATGPGGAPPWPPERVLLAVGPEGGWTPVEVESAVAAGARILALGPRILRVETAAIVALSLVLACCGALGASAAGQDEGLPE